LGERDSAKVYRSISILAEHGITLREPHTKPLRDGIFELRVSLRQGIARVLYFFFVGRKIVVTNGIIKKTQKTPPEAIEKAKAYRKEYLERRSGR